jgi:DNA polymerase-1
MAQKKEKKRLLVIDGNSLLHRAWHALPPSLTTKDGIVINAVYGFTSLLLKALRELSPDFIVVAFDRKEPTFRHEAYEAYKATREKQPEELYAQLPILKSVLETMGVPFLEKAGFEADDIIGTVVAHSKGAEKIIMTGDLDILQLIDSETKVYTPKKGISDLTVYDESAVRDRYGLTPEQMIDFKALRGDPSDNIPGVRGIGEKTATILLSQFGTLDTIYRVLETNDPRMEKVSARVRELLSAGKEQAFLSKKLVTIVLDVPVAVSLEKLRLKPFNRPEIQKLFQELGFKSLLERLPAPSRSPAGTSGGDQPGSVGDGMGTATTGGGSAEPTGSASACTVVTTDRELEALISVSRRAGVLAIKTEADNANPLLATPLGWGIAAAGKVWFVPADFFPKQGLSKEFAMLLEDERVRKIGHNIKYDFLILRGRGVTLRGIVGDTTIASYLLSPGSRSHDLETMVAEVLGRSLTPPPKETPGATEALPLGTLAFYFCEGVAAISPIHDRLQERLRAEGLDRVYADMDIPLIPVLGRMEEAGILVDTKFLKKRSVDLAQKLGALGREIHRLAGTEFNINSPAQLREILFEKLQIKPPRGRLRRTGGGELSTAASELEKMRGAHPIIDPIFEHRELSKLKSTYVDALPELVNPATGRVHTTFHETVTATGRLSSSNPNLQNIPIRTELGREIRKAFVAPRGMRILAADYSQIELRILAALAGDEAMLAAFRAGEDIHTRTAAEIADVAPEKVTSDMRRAAKAINFGIAFGMGANSLAEAAGVSLDRARDFIDRYFAVHSRLREYLDETKAIAAKRGYVETLFGRRRPIPNITSTIPYLRAEAERMAVNMPVQGTEADLIKLAMIAIDKELPKISGKSRMLLQVHDELVFEVPEPEVRRVGTFVKDTMENIRKLPVPIKVDLHGGKNWGEMEDWD